MRQSTRIVVNALISYGRMVITVGLGLLTTRLVLANLGLSDFGLFALLSSVTGFMTTAAAASAASVQRHLAIEIGRNDFVGLKRTFATSLAIHFVFALAILLVGFSLKVFALNTLNIPASRSVAAENAFMVILIGASIMMALSPVSALFGAKQLLARDAVFAVLTSAAAFAVALSLPHLNGDRLEQFTYWQIGTQVLLTVAQAIVAMALFSEARIGWKDAERARVKSLLSITGWSLLGSWAWAARMYGGTILLNGFFGPIVTAGYAVAMQAGTYVSNFSSVLVRVAQPAMSTLEGRGRPEAFSRLMYMTSKAMLVASSLIALPLIVAPSAALHIWLRVVPETAISFVPLILCSILVLHSLVGHNTAMLASGAIAHVALRMFMLLVVAIPVAIGVFSLTDAPAQTYGWILLTTAIVAAIYYVRAASSSLGERSGAWVKNVAQPTLITIALSCVVGLLIKPWIVGLFTFGAAAVAIDVTMLVGSWFIVLDLEERRLVIQALGLRSKMNR